MTGSSEGLPESVYIDHCHYRQLYRIRKYNIGTSIICARGYTGQNPKLFNNKNL